jgi:hypothetical protein
MILLVMFAAAAFASTCTPKAGTKLTMEKCGGAESYPQQWVFDAGELHLVYTFYEGLCLDAGDGKQRTELLMKDCSPTSRVQQTFDMVAEQGSHFIVHNASGGLPNTNYSPPGSLTCLCVACFSLWNPRPVFDN